MSLSHDPLADRLRTTPASRVLALAAIAAIAPLVAIVILVTVADLTSPVSPVDSQLHQALVGIPVVVGLYMAGRRFVLRAPAAWFLAGWPDRGLLGWVAVGLALPTLVLGLELAVLGTTRVATLPPAPMIARYVTVSLAGGLLAGVTEELAFRGALLRLLWARWGYRTGLVGSTVIFAGLHQGHATNGQELVLVLSSMVAAGILLGVVVLRTRSVWNAVAVHAGWNTVFGGRVVAVAPPGGVPEPAVLQLSLTTPSTLLTGGSATLGAAPMTTGLLLVAAIVCVRHGDQRQSRPGGQSRRTVFEEDR